MEIFMTNIPVTFHREYHLKVLLAKHLHGSNSPNVKANFHIDLYRQEGIKTCVGTFTLDDLRVAERFLSIYGGKHPRKNIEIGGNRIYFRKSTHPPNPQVLELLHRSPWVDPAREREQLKWYEKLSSTPLPVKAVQVGWMCRDRVFSIEGEERNRSCNLIFEPERHEVHLVFPRAQEQYNTHVIAIRQTSILSVSAHTAGGDSAVYFQLEIPPLLLHRKLDHKPFSRMSSLPFQTLNPRATPFISLALRVVFLWSDSLNTFIDLAKTAGVHHIQDFQVATERRKLFGHTRLQRVEADIQSLDWPVAFQLEALLRNLCLNATELSGIIPQIKPFLQEHGSHYVATLLRAFAGKVRNLSCDSKNTIQSVLDCLDETHQALVKQTVLNQPFTTEQSLYQTSHVTVTPTTILLTGPFLEKSNRVIRRYQKNHQENFLRVEFREEDGFQYRFDRGVNERGFLRGRLGPMLKDRLVVAGREFEFLAYSQSASREHSVW